MFSPDSPRRESEHQGEYDLASHPTPDFVMLDEHGRLERSPARSETPDVLERHWGSEPAAGAAEAPLQEMQDDNDDPELIEINREQRRMDRDEMEIDEQRSLFLHRKEETKQRAG